MLYVHKTFNVVPSSRPPEHCAGTHWWDRHGKCVQCGTPKPSLAELEARLLNVPASFTVPPYTPLEPNDS